MKISCHTQEHNPQQHTQTLRKERGPKLFRDPASAPSTTNFTVGDAAKAFWPGQFMA